jgi:DNA polymerase-3 subunit delta'
MNLPWLDDIKAQLDEAFVTERLGHAPLIQGPAGVGKRALGEWLSRRILCLEGGAAAPCGECRSCQLLSSETHPDFFPVDIPEDKREIPVDSIRNLNGRLQLTSSLTDRRVGRILPAEAMNTNAANALLKTLEEPAGNAWLILISDRPGRLPATIRSRCQAIAVRPPAHDEASLWLKAQIRERDLEVSENDAEQALRLAGDAPLAALALVETDGLAFGFTIRDGLVAAARGRAIEQVIDSHWTDRAELTWRWIATWAGLALQASLRAGDASDLLGDLPSALEPAQAARLWDKALTGGALVRGNARQDLLIGKWLLEWSQVSQPGT